MIVYIYNIGVDLYNGFNGLRHRINWTYFTVLDGLAHPLYSVTDAWVGNYYLQQDGSMATNTWIGNYYVDSNGLWTPDQWIVSNGKYWYRHQDGSYTINDFEVINGQTYYFDANGYMVTGWQKINDKDYYFNESGAMATNTWIGNYHVDADGKWDLTR